MTNVTCPHCSESFAVAGKVVMPDEQRMSFLITHEHPLLSVKTIHGTLAQLEKLLKATAKDVGSNCHVFVEGVRSEPGKMTFDLFIADHDAKRRTAKSAPQTTPTQRQNMNDDKVTIERELELIDGMIEVQLHHAKQCDGIANRTMAEKQKGWDMERVALLRKMRAALAAQPAEPCMDTVLRNAARRSATIVDRGRLVQPVEPDMRHPKIQALIGQNARQHIWMMLVEQLVEDPNFETTAMDMEYWDTLHDKLKEKLTAAPVAVPLTDERIVELFRETFLAHTDPLGKDNMTIAFARAIERAHGIAAGDKP